MTLQIPNELVAKLSGLAVEGIDLVYVAVVYYGGSVGTRYYSTREIPQMPGTPWEAKLLAVPQVPKRNDPSAVRFDALSDDLVLRIRNTPEAEDGHYDSIADFKRGRVQDLMTEVPLNGAKVEVGVAEMRLLTDMTDIKWDGVYKVDRVERDNKEASLYCVDRMLHPGEVMIGQTVNDSDWPLAPAESYGMVRGPVFGKVDGLPLVPVEVGLFATLASEIDDQDGIIDLSAGDLSQWPQTGYVEIGDEIVYYPVIDKTLKRLGNSLSKCTRGTGYPKTVAAAHNDNAVAKELYTGKKAALNGNHAANATSLTMRGPAYLLPASGVIVIDNEAIRYNTNSGNVLSGLSRAIPVPTIAKVHDAGSPVRTIPVGPDGLPRYRYAVADGAVNAVSNLRVRDESGNDLPYLGGSGTKSAVTVASGKIWSVLDLPARPRFEKFENSGSQIPQDWICATDGRVDSEGVALPKSFTHWGEGDYMSQEHMATWPRAIDPNASTRAVIMEATTGKNIFSLIWDGRWDQGLNSPRSRYGRFRDARVKFKVQYNQQTTVQPVYEIYSNTELVKTGVFLPPSIGGGSGDGSVTGSQKLPESRWGTQKQTKEVRLSSRFTNAYGDGSNGYWVDPVKLWSTSGGVLPGGGRADHSAAFDGDTRSFLSGAWSFISGTPFIVSGANTGLDLGPLLLFSNDTFADPSSTDKLTTMYVTVHNPVGWESFWTGWTGSLILYKTTEHSGASRAFQVGIGPQESRKTFRIDLTGLSWLDCQSIKLSINQHSGGGIVRGATIGEVSMAVEYQPDVEGQRVGTIVDGSYFRTTATTAPSTIFEQVVSLGAVAKNWARQHDLDAWDFFSSGPLSFFGCQIMIKLPSAGDGLQFAVADMVLELEYDALTVVYDGTVLADVDGRTGYPVGGGALEVLQNPVDVLAHLVDSTEFLNLSGERSTDWAAYRTLCDGIGWRMSRAVVEPIPLRELVASLCSESRLLLLADGKKLYVRFRWEEATPAESIEVVGEQLLPENALVTDQVKIVNRLEDVFNSIGFYYRRNYALADFRAVIEEEDAESIRLYGKRRATPNLEWHQSSRGYGGGLAEQKDKLRWLTKYTIDMASRLWDFATIEVSAAPAEAVQRYDVMTVNWPRSGYYMTPGRVVTTQRLDNPMRWQITLQMNRSTLGYIWQSEENPQTYIKLAEAGSRMDFVVQGTLVAQLTSAGHWRCRGGFSLSGTSTVDVAKVDTGASIIVYRERRDGSFSGKFERMLTVGEFGDVTVHGYNNGTVTATRGAATPGTLLNVGGVGGIVDTVAPSQTGRLEFYLANRMVMVIDSGKATLLGNIRANLGFKMGSNN